MDGIIFDVDGTLWDSTETVAKAWNQAVAEHTDLKIELDGESLQQLFGKTMDEIFAALLPDLPPEEQMRIGYICFDYENRLLEIMPGKLYDGVEETLKELSRSTNLYIVSNCQCGYIEILLKTTGLGAYIKDHLCYGETLVSKDQTILQLMERNNLKDVVYVGDTQGDCNACKKAGIPFVFAEYGFGNVPEAGKRIGSMRELIGI